MAASDRHGGRNRQMKARIFMWYPGSSNSELEEWQSFKLPRSVPRDDNSQQSQPSKPQYSQHHQLETKHSNSQAYGAQSHSNHAPNDI